MSDPFKGHSTGLTSPACDLYDITPDDSAELDVFPRGLAVTGSGLVRMTAIGGTTATLYVAAGAPCPVRVRKVWATGTDATGIVGIV